MNDISFTNLTEVFPDLYKEILAFYKEQYPEWGGAVTGSYDSVAIAFSIYLYEWLFYADTGRGPGGWPPKDKILRWVQRKRLADIFVDKRGKALKEESITFLVRRKIAEKGVVGYHRYFKNIAFENDVQEILNRFMQDKLAFKLDSILDDYGNIKEVKIHA